MCTTCGMGGCSCIGNSSILPIGPTGATGETGAQGDPGTNGLNGTTVIDGYTSATGISTPNSLVETSLFLATIPANTLLGTNDEIELYSYFEYNNNDSVDITFKLGGLSIYTYAQINAENEKFTFKIKNPFY